ncbi:MAG: hypothetical protein A3D44_00895 [Candidatus Staskawiczbacteria bacterium RIFCSPHIGHO2_02_FULL_42_22]|uniref:ABC transporter ATP-binding protein n=1 Tax=Candidatus Staskawiczbacteria bacterium RIFCSPHIGHO2_02_FULL_42_22 TaxID=1802207 RepID=A0A1G2I485_9BACT|nr:MAG: hypothetical protein A3D44_00895 [Candidatus Staskawiczbacteria bacterium RIFCSPHIGHO2_02_FULL_42_22]
MMTVLRAYWPSVCKYRWLALAMVLFMVVTVLNKAAYPFLVRDLLGGLKDGSVESVTRTIWLIALLLFVTNVTWYLYDFVILFFEATIMRDLSQRSFAVVQTQSMRFFENSFAGSLVTSAKRFCHSFEHITDAFAYQLGRSFVWIILTLVVFSWEYPWLGLTFGVWVIVFCSASIYIAHLRMKRDAIAAEKDSKVGGAFADSFSNQATVKSFGKERDEQQRFDGVAEDCYQHTKYAWIFGVNLIRVQGFICSAFEIALVLFLVAGWRNGTVTMADFVFFQTWAIIIIDQVWQIGNIMNKVFRSVGEAKEMAALYTQKPEVQDAITARPLNVEDGEIEFHAVNFSYVDRETRAHHDVNDFTLHIPGGQSVALVGHTGAGKSTLVKLLLRYFDLNSGYIRIDRQDVVNVTQISLRQQIAVVPQQPELFHRTLRENIVFARPDASEEEIIVAAKRSHAWEFISRLPDGLNTLVGERGVKLSGGERQRIALARAFLADVPILVLDEATSALDSKTEHQIQSAIADLLEGRTCIVIAHRLSTIQRADRIIVMESGSIAEEGTHQELLDQGGVYAELWDHQSGGYITD